MRKVLEDIGTPDHLALAYDAWARVGGDGKLADSKRAEWTDTLAKTKIAGAYKHSFKRWKQSFTHEGDRLAELVLTSRLLVGHGNSSAVDVGLTVHHTWGVPIIPGSALKGLLAHYIDATYGPTDPDLEPWQQPGEERTRADYQGVTWGLAGPRPQLKRGPGPVYRALFGAPSAAEDDVMRAQGLQAGASAGLVTFHDALYVPGSSPGDQPFAADVLTVHQPGYYNCSGKSAPNDYDSPNPVQFITVRPRSRLLLALCGPPEWTELAAQLLCDALKTWGVGGKTSAGYGIGSVGQWTSPEPRRSKAEQAALTLQRHGKDAVRGDIETWLRDEKPAGPLRELLATPPGATSTDHLAAIRLLGAWFALRDEWTKRLKRKKASEEKKAQARALLKTWDTLFPEQGST